VKKILDIIAKTQWYIVTLLVVLATSVWTLNWVSAPVSNDHTPVMVEIERGWSGFRIATELKKHGLIRSRWGFYTTVGMRREKESLKPGKYELRRDMPMLQIIEILVHGQVAASRVTIPEGFDLRRIASRLSAAGVVNENDFLATAQQSPFPEFPSLEGYLFPDTYVFPRDSKCSAIVGEMLDNLKKKVSDPLSKEIAAFPFQCPATPAQWDAQRRRLHAVLTLASLVEREAKSSKDRSLIASVLYNRIRKGMPLQVDATVQYALGRHRSRLFYVDYKTPSEYNTYLHKGLPPGPIASPGLRSIEATLKPASTNYLYYVARADGSHVFSTTLAEHNRAKLSIRRANPVAEVR
jgi:UPF0755 protein